MNSNISINWMC